MVKNKQISCFIRPTFQAFPFSKKDNTKTCGEGLRFISTNWQLSFPHISPPFICFCFSSRILKYEAKGEKNVITIESPRANFFSYFSPFAFIVLFFLLFTYRYNKQQGILASMGKIESYICLRTVKQAWKMMEIPETKLQVFD